MNFFSVKEYFYKLNTIGFILLLLPVGLFVFLHFYYRSTWPAINVFGEDSTLLIILGAVLVGDLTIVHLLWNARLKKLKMLNELAKKMDGYLLMVAARNGSYTGVALLMAFGFYLTGSVYFTGGFFLILLAVILQWPGPARFCKHLDLRGSEKDMVMNNRDLPRNPSR